jgi:hypothetical protein
MRSANDTSRRYPPKSRGPVCSLLNMDNEYKDLIFSDGKNIFAVTAQS